MCRSNRLRFRACTKLDCTELASPSAMSKLLPNDELWETSPVVVVVLLTLSWTLRLDFLLLHKKNLGRRPSSLFTTISGRVASTTTASSKLWLDACGRTTKNTVKDDLSKRHIPHPSTQKAALTQFKELRNLFEVRKIPMAVLAELDLDCVILLFFKLCCLLQNVMSVKISVLYCPSVM